MKFPPVTSEVLDVLREQDQLWADRLFATEGEVDDIVDDWREFFERRIGAALLYPCRETAAKLNGRGGMKSDAIVLKSPERIAQEQQERERCGAGAASAARPDSRTKRSPRPRRASRSCGRRWACRRRMSARAFVVKCSTS